MARNLLAGANGKAEGASVNGAIGQPADGSAG
jgi:hypothetical protein